MNNPKLFSRPTVSLGPIFSGKIFPPTRLFRWLCLILMAGLLAVPAWVHGEMLGGWYEDGLRQFFPSATDAGTRSNEASRTIAHSLPDIYRSSTWTGDASGSSWISYDLSWPDTLGTLSLNLSRVKIMWNNTENERFRVEVKADDGSPWTEAYRGVSDGTDNNHEVHNFTPMKAKHVRIVIPDGNSPSIRYIQFYGTVEGDTIPFVHPGMTTTSQDVAKIRELVENGVQPNRAAWEKLQDEPRSRTNVSANPSSHIQWTAVQTEPAQKEFSGDCVTAYYQALMWMMTEDPVYAKNVLKIMNAWNDTLVSSGGNNALASFGSTINIAQAIELVKYSYSGWDAQIESDFLDLIENHVVAHIEARYFGDNNWSSQHNKAIMGLAILRNDRYQFNRAVQRMKQIIDGTDAYGGVHELCSRDWNHALMHTGSIGEGAEVAWNQGVDLYSYRNNHVATIFNYHAWIDLAGGDSDEYPDPGCVVKYQNGVVKPADVKLDPFSWENVYNHYRNRVGVPTPKLEEKMRIHRSNGDVDGYTHHYGWGSLIDANVGDTRENPDVNLRVKSTDPGRVTGAEIDESRVGVILHVDQAHPGAGDDTPATAEQPMRTLGAAFERAKRLLGEGTGVKVRIAPGVYREGGLVFDGSALGPRARDAVLVIEGGEGVILRGSEDWSDKDWEPVRDAAGEVVYHQVDWPHDFGLKGPGWGRFDPVGTAAYRREMVFVDGALLPDMFVEQYQFNPDAVGGLKMEYAGFVDPATHVKPGTFAVAERDENGNKLFLKLPDGIGIGDAMIEVAVHPFLLALGQMENVVIRGIQFDHAASDHKHQALIIGSPSWMGLGGLDGAWNNRNILVEDCRMVWNNAHGLMVNGADRITLRRCESSYNGIGGIRNWTLRNLLIEDLATHFNNWRGPRGGMRGWGIAGMKSHGVYDAIVRRHHAVGNITEGQWWDVDNRNITIEDLVAIGNLGRGLFLELSGGPFHLKRSLIADSYTAVFRLDSAQDVTIEDSIFHSSATDGDVLNITAKDHPNARTTRRSTQALIEGRPLGKVPVRSGPWRMNGSVVASQADGGSLIFMNSSPADFYSAMMAGERYAGRDNVYYHPANEQPFGIGFEKTRMANFGKWLEFANEQGATWQDPKFRDPAVHDFRLAPESPLIGRSEALPAYHMPTDLREAWAAFRAYIDRQPAAAPAAQSDGDASYVE